MLLHVVVIGHHRRRVLSKLVLTKHHASSLGAAVLVRRGVGPRLTEVHRRGLLVGVVNVLQIDVVVHVIVLLAVRLVELRHHIVLARANFIC